MSNVYEGKPDARQKEDPKHQVSRFRPTYRALSDDEKKLHDEIKDQARLLELLFDRVTPGGSRYKSLAITSLEEAIMWIVKDLTSSGNQ